MLIYISNENKYIQYVSFGSILIQYKMSNFHLVFSKMESTTLREMWFFPQETGVVCIVYVGWTENMVTSKKLLFVIKYEFYPKKNKLHPKRIVVKYPDELHCCLRETDFAFSQKYFILSVYFTV